MDNENKKTPARSSRAKAKMTPQEENNLAEEEIKRVQSKFSQAATEANSKTEKVAEPNKGPDVRYPAHPLTHVQNVLNSTAEQGFAGATEAAKKADKKTVKEAAMLVIPPDWRGTFPPLMEKLTDEDTTLILAYFAHIWHEGYRAGQFDAGRGTNVQIKAPKA